MEKEKVHWCIGHIAQVIIEIEWFGLEDAFKII